MKQLLLTVVALIAISGALTLSAGAEDPTVNATISTKVVGISVNQTTLDYGTLMPGDTGKKPNPAFFSVTNTGSIEVDVDIRGSNTTHWTLGSSAGANQFVHYFDTDSDIDTTKTLAVTNKDLWNDLAVSAAVDVHLMLDMPTSTSSFATQTASIVLVATE